MVKMIVFILGVVAFSLQTHAAQGRCTAVAKFDGQTFRGTLTKELHRRVPRQAPRPQQRRAAARACAKALTTCGVTKAQNIKTLYNRGNYRRAKRLWKAKCKIVKADFFIPKTGRVKNVFRGFRGKALPFAMNNQ